MKIRVILNGRGGELDRVEIDTIAFADQYDLIIQRRIHAAIGEWTLRPGDTIEIEGDE